MNFSVILLLWRLRADSERRAKFGIVIAETLPALSVMTGAPIWANLVWEEGVEGHGSKVWPCPCNRNGGVHIEVESPFHPDLCAWLFVCPFDGLTEGAHGPCVWGRLDESGFWLNWFAVESDGGQLLLPGFDGPDLLQGCGIAVPPAQPC